MNAVKDKSFEFAVRIVNLGRYLMEDKREYVLSKQLMRSGTAIGAIYREAQQAESQADFIHKMSIALKEANESLYWLDLLLATKFIDRPQYDVVNPLAVELVKMITSIVKTSKARRVN